MLLRLKTVNQLAAILVLMMSLIAFSSIAQTQSGWVLSHQKVSSTEGGFIGTLNDGDQFGKAVSSLGDINLDGVPDLAVGANLDDAGGNNRGAVWLLFLDINRNVKSVRKISENDGGFKGRLDDNDFFGWSIASLGDLDGDGIIDLAVGARGDDDGGLNSGAVWILFLNSNGTVKSHQKISDTEGEFTGTLDNSDLFGFSVASLGDIDGDGINDLAVGSQLDDDGGTNRGAVWILFLNNDGTVKSHQKISNTESGFSGILENGDWFGWSVTTLGDLDSDGINDIAVGATGDDDGGNLRGAVWIVFLNSDGTVKSNQKISDIEGSFTGILDDSDEFGTSLALLDDLDSNGVNELAVGVRWDDDGGLNRGAVWVLFLNNDGSVESHQKISDTEGGFVGKLDDSDHFGRSVTSLGDSNGNGIFDLVVGSPTDDDGGLDRGAVWILSIDGNAVVKCQWDLDGDDTVGTSDLLELFAQWGTAGPADFDESGAVDTADLLILFANWGPCP